MSVSLTRYHMYGTQENSMARSTLVHAVTQTTTLSRDIDLGVHGLHKICMIRSSTVGTKSEMRDTLVFATETTEVPYEFTIACMDPCTRTNTVRWDGGAFCCWLCRRMKNYSFTRHRLQPLE